MSQPNVPPPTTDELRILRQEAAQNVPTAHKALGGDSAALKEWRAAQNK